jgi:hypothetical protein
MATGGDGDDWMRKFDIAGGLFFLAFVAVMVFVIIPRENAGGVWHGLSPYFYPMIMLTGIAVSSVGLLVQAVSKPRLYDDQPHPLSWSDLGFFLLSYVIILLCVFVIHRFGTWVGGPLLIAATMVFMGELRPVRIAIVSVLTVAVTHVLVTHLLQIPLP